MEYLNIPVSTFRSPEFIGADPVQRGTWSALMGWCASQETGGRIEGCRAWKDRMWQQAMGVTSAEVLDESPLWFWEGDDLVLIHYPLGHEQALHAKRDGGAHGGKSTSPAKQAAARANGSKGGRPPRVPTGNPSITQASTEAEPNVKEGKERECKGREGECAGAMPRGEAAPLTPSLLSSFDRVKIRLEAVFPNATKALTGREREALHANAEALDELADDDWLGAQCWVACGDRIRDRDLWPRDRLEFIERVSDAMQQIRPWWAKTGRKWWEGKQGSREPPAPAIVEIPSDPSEALRLWNELKQSA